MITRLSLTFTFALALFIAAYATLPTASAAPELQANYGTKTLSFNGITSTTRACAEFPYADKTFVQLTADIATTNTALVDVLYTNDGANFTTGDVLSGTVATDTATIATGNLFTVSLLAKSVCVRVTPSGSNALTVTAFLAAPPRVE